MQIILKVGVAIEYFRKRYHGQIKAIIPERGIERAFGFEIIWPYDEKRAHLIIRKDGVVFLEIGPTFSDTAWLALSSEQKAAVNFIPAILGGIKTADSRYNLNPKVRFGYDFVKQTAKNLGGDLEFTYGFLWQSNDNGAQEDFCRACV